MSSRTASRASSRGNTIAVVIPLGHDSTQSLSDPFFSEMLGHLAEAITNRKYSMLVRKVVPPMSDWLQSLIESEQADGILILGQSSEQALLENTSRTFAPMVVWGGALPGQTYCCVGSDNAGGARAAVEHLLSMGRRRILFVGDKSVPEFKIRYEGYCSALAAGPGSGAAEAVYSHLDHRSARDAIRALIAERKSFDALFAASDVIALAALQVLAEAGILVPKDVAVVGFDDIGAAGSSKPSLTTVKQNLRSGAHALVEQLFRRLSSESSRSVLLPTKLIIRQSCGAEEIDSNR